jgi:hypothetical protein
MEFVDRFNTDKWTAADVDKQKGQYALFWDQ